MFAIFINKSNNCVVISRGTSLTIYRGQSLSNTDFDQMTKTTGGLISFDNFLFTSKDRNVYLAFADSNQSNPDVLEILFVMKMDIMHC